MSMEPETIQTPLIRIRLFGPLDIARCGPGDDPASQVYHPLLSAVSADEPFDAPRRSRPLSLLTLLLCQPHRYAPRDLLLETFWTERSVPKAVARLDDLVSELRRLLCAERGKEVLQIIRSSGTTTGYQLASYPLIWVDADAFTWYIEQAALLERFGDDPFPCWEAAYQLGKRGVFLQDDPYSEWAQSRRETLEGLFRQCVHWLAQRAREQGALAEAEMRLRLLLGRCPTDEDALRPLLELLAEQERYQEGLVVAARVQRRVREELERELDGRTLEVVRYLQSKPIVHKQAVSRVMVEQQKLAHVLAAPFMARTKLSDISLPSFWRDLRGADDSIDEEYQDGLWLFQGAGALGQLYHAGWSSDTLAEAVNILFPVFRAIPADTARHDVLRTGAATMLSGFSFVDKKRCSAEEQQRLLLALQEGITAGWKLFHTAGNAQVLAVGQALLFLLRQLHAHIPPSLRPSIYTGVYGLVGMAFYMQGQSQRALQAHQSAYIAALESGEIWSVVQNLIAQSNTYQALGEHRIAIQVIEEALRLVGEPRSDEALIRARAHLFACWADNALEMEEYTSAQRQLDAAARYLDAIQANEEFDRSNWLLLAGKHAFLIKDYSAAVQYLEQALAEASCMCLLREALASITLAVVYIWKHERDASLCTITQALPTLQKINVPTINIQLSRYVQGVLKAFSYDQEIQHFLDRVKASFPELLLPEIHGI